MGAGVRDSDAEGSAEGEGEAQSQTVGSVDGLASAIGEAVEPGEGDVVAFSAGEHALTRKATIRRMASTRLGPRVVITPTLRAIPDRGSGRC